MLPAEALAAIDAEASPVLRERIGQEEARYAAGEQQYQADTEAAHEQARVDVTALEEQTRAQQEDPSLLRLRNYLIPGARSPNI